MRKRVRGTQRIFLYSGLFPPSPSRVHLSGCMEIAIISANSRDKSVLPYSCEPQLPACRQTPANTHIQTVHLHNHITNFTAMINCAVLHMVTYGGRLISF